MHTTYKGIMSSEGRGRRGVLAVAALVGLAFTTGCEVTNPGPVADEYLVLPAAQQGFVNGAKERVTRSVGWLSYNTGLVSREIFPGGQTGSYGHTILMQSGSPTWSESGPNNSYPNSQQARWIAEEAIRRFTDVGNVTPALMFQAYLWAGYANRLLGENWCEAVIDGSAIQPGATYLERAEKHFTNALAIAPTANDRLAALGGRAQVRVLRANWKGAVEDAQRITSNTFRFDIEMDISRGANTNQRNHLYFGAASIPYRSYSVKFTYFEQYYTDTGDPRTPWITYVAANDRLCVGSLQGYGRVPCLRAWKYKSEDDDIRLASGREMRLIEAEALLIEGKVPEAMAKINGIRASITSDKTKQALQPWTATTSTEAWKMLKRERGIELWLEARRMADQRRWEPILGQQKTPGDLELPNFEARSTVFVQNPRGREITLGQPTPRVLCYNISNDERNSNPNIDDVPTGT